MVVDDTDGLHERIANRRSDECEAALAQVLAQAVRQRRARRNLRAASPLVAYGFAVDEVPHVGVETSKFLAHGKQRPRVRHRREHFRAIADDAGILQNTLASRRRKPRHALRIELREDRAIAFSLTQNRIPTQPCLRSFEREKLEEHAIVVRGSAPLRVIRNAYCRNTWSTHCYGGPARQAQPSR